MLYSLLSLPKKNKIDNLFLPEIIAETLIQLINNKTSIMTSQCFFYILNMTCWIKDGISPKNINSIQIILALI